ncbi:MAG: ribonuclease P protein component [Eubacteriales bacterium]|nr:ribonuclease P protein component [Eubacteriales bacterium]
MLRRNVLRKKSDFSAVYNHGKSAADRFVVVFYRKNRLGMNRISFLASKKIGNSVYRNRARRLLRESLRLIQQERPLPEGYDIILIARRGISDQKCQTVMNSLKRALKRTEIK